MYALQCNTVFSTYLIVNVIFTQSRKPTIIDKVLWKKTL